MQCGGVGVGGVTVYCKQSATREQFDITVGRSVALGLSLSLDSN